VTLADALAASRTGEAVLPGLIGLPMMRGSGYSVSVLDAIRDDWQPVNPERRKLESAGYFWRRRSTDRERDKAKCWPDYVGRCSNPDHQFQYIDRRSGNDRRKK
jgi:hypothetical protein